MKKLIILVLLIACNVNAALTGDLDTSFSNDGMTDGWTFYGPIEANNNTYEADGVLLDAQGRLYTLMWHQDSNGDYGLYVLRFSSDGSLDASYANSGVSDDLTQLSSSHSLIESPDYKPELAFDANGGIFVAYTIDQDYHYPQIFHLDSNGNKIGEITIEIPDGTSYINAWNGLNDIVFIESQSKLAIASTVDYSSTDKDFGISVINVNNTTGALTLDANFNLDGMNTCWFDQGVSTEKRDIPHAVLWDETNQKIIVAGVAHEGNGDHNDGRNAAFCEFDLVGDLKQKWSTQIIPPSISPVHEFSRNIESAEVITLHDGVLIVAGEVYENSSQFGVFSYERDFFTGEWGRVVSFGSPATSGWGLGENLSNIVNSVYVEDMVVENSGRILVVGRSSGSSSSYMAMVKFTKTGKQDVDWGNNGDGSYVIKGFNGTGNGHSSGYAVVEDSKDESIYVAGSSLDENGNSKMFLAKFYNDIIFKHGFE